MTDFKKPPSKNTIIRVFAFCAFNIAVMPLVPYFFGKSYTEAFVQYFIFYALVLIIVPIIWFAGLKIFNLDAKGSVPWYASPLVWFTPVFVVVLYFMFSGENV